MLTSQRLCDVILQAFEACACSQGCMNNFLFGDGTFGYYETIAGGMARNIACDLRGVMNVLQAVALALHLTEPAAYVDFVVLWFL